MIKQRFRIQSPAVPEAEPHPSIPIDSQAVNALDEDKDYAAWRGDCALEHKHKHRVRQYEKSLYSRTDLHKFCRERLKDITDFDYLFWHRRRLKPDYRERLERIASKLLWKDRDGFPGYFAAMEANGIDWKSDASVLAFVPDAWAESVLKCGTWTAGNSTKRNSGRCHQHDFCPFCLWIDHLKFLTQAFSEETGAFQRGRNWFSMHLSVRTSAANAVANGRTLTGADWNNHNHTGLRSASFQPCPIRLHADLDGEDFNASHTCRLVFWAIHTALKGLYPKLLKGYRHRLELALRLGPTWGLPHGHAVGYSKEINPQFIAEQLWQQMSELLNQCKPELSVPLFPSVRVYAVPSPADLLRALKYLEKPLPMALLAREALKPGQAPGWFVGPCLPR